jgi:cytochrome c peroxidase
MVQVIDRSFRFRFAGREPRAPPRRVANPRRFLPTVVPLSLLVLALVVAGAGAEQALEEPITPVPSRADWNAARAALGSKLFYDKRLSRGDRVACVSCHRLDRGGGDEHPRATGLDGKLLDFNTPTIFNVTLNFRLNWRGNFRTLEEQNEAVLLDSRLMNSSWEELLSKLRADPEYRASFASLYGSDPVRTSVLDALAVFQRSLTTPNARFDRYLRGEENAITAEERRGYLLFKAYGCVTCHQGVNVGGNLFQKFGIFFNPFAQRATTTTADLGRYGITGQERDRHVFRVPSLRNVAVAAPYFHDGSVASLFEAVEIMARSQLGRTIEAQEIEVIVKFLATLTGEYQGRILDSESKRVPP